MSLWSFLLNNIGIPAFKSTKPRPIRSSLFNHDASVWQLYCIGQVVCGWDRASLCTFSSGGLSKFSESHLASFQLSASFTANCIVSKGVTSLLAKIFSFLTFHMYRSIPELEPSHQYLSPGPLYVEEGIKSFENNSRTLRQWKIMNLRSWIFNFFIASIFNHVPPKNIYKETIFQIIWKIRNYKQCNMVDYFTDMYIRCLCKNLYKKYYY